MAVETGDPWIDEVAARDHRPAAAGGHRRGHRPRSTGRPGWRQRPPTDSYDMALVTRTASPFQTTTAAWYSDGLGLANSTGTAGLEPVRRPRGRPAVHPGRTGAQPGGRRDHLRPDRRPAVGPDGGPAPVREPALVANGVQIANVQYNPSVDGILWNVAMWTVAEARTAAEQVERSVARGTRWFRWAGSGGHQTTEFAGGPCRAVGRRRATMPVAPVATPEPLRRSGGIGRRASLRG